VGGRRLLAQYRELLARALRLAERDTEAAVVERRFPRARSQADVAVRSACFCQPGV